MTQVIKIDFEADMRKALEADLVVWGHTVPAVAFPELVALYANLKRRRIETKPRRVHVATTLVVPPARQAGYDLVSQKASSGADLNPHLSKTVHKRAAYDDMMLNDWVMHHVHLGTASDPNNPALMGRTKELLFAMVDSDDIYFVAIGEHGDWADQRLFDTARTHWPHLFQQLKGFKVQPVTEEDTKALRAAGVSVVQAGPGGVPILPRGGGYATSGRSLEVTRSADRLVQRLRSVTAKFQANVPRILEEANKRRIKVDELDFHLAQDEEQRFIACDEKHRLVVPLE